jgi:ABC-type transport system involved in multi-copper enzyme maturation permease subunit
LSPKDTKSPVVRFLLTPFRILDEIRLVAAWDMTRQARRPSFFLMRGALAAFIAIQVILLWWGQIEERRTRFGIDDAALIPVNQIVYAVERIFSGSILIMSIGLILFCPALTSGSIAGDRERKIWHDLANSPLSGWSILMGKMVARLATVFAWILVAMPLWALLSLIGGLDPRAISLVMLGMFCYGWMFASFGMLASVATKRSRDALGLVTSFLCFLLFLPLAGPALLQDFGIPLWGLDKVADLALLFNPGITLQAIPESIGDNPIARRAIGVSLSHFFLIIGLSGPILTLIAGLLLRPLGRRLDSAGTASESRTEPGGNLPHRSIATYRAPKRSVLSPVNLANYPMVVKEMRVRAGSRLTRNLRRLALGLYFLATLAILARFSIEALGEILQYGFFSTRSSGRNQLMTLVYAVSGISAALLQYGLMLEAAGRMVMEKEQDTWTTLLSTTLEPKEILAGKAFGAFWNWRWTFVHLGICMGTAILLGGMHPIALFLVLIVWSIQLTFMTVLGLRIGMNSSTHAAIVSKCMGATLLFQIVLPILAAWVLRDESALMMHPVILATISVGIESRNSATLDLEALLTAILVLTCFSLASLGIVVQTLSKFDAKTDRE